MFYKAPLTTKILVPALYLGPTLHESVKGILCKNVEGKVERGTQSFVIAVLDVLALDRGKIQESGEVLFFIEYEALVQKVSVNEVVHGVVESILPPNTVKYRVGPLTSQVRITSSKSSGEEYIYDPDIKGLIGRERGAAFKEGSVAKIRIVNTSIPANGIKILGELA
ncbi:RNA polymerase Rpb7 N-terminal [Perkinsela sp. CCAP 1560/4]|nr:RNA polymerase Rpb7 N-terminal [Perkinsela sp. CCAP 1560/4]|eukprot:KNH07530.1 RNA polymerase Rpb7 N-terminal [Perkinsela sp. CCAP 1560/4]